MVAEKIKAIDVHAYAASLRRILELVCNDKNATGKTLANKIADLADKNKIPSELVEVARNLKEFGNIGAHGGDEELSENEVPIVKSLCLAILEYLYSAPYLANLAKKKLEEIRGKVP